MKTKIKNQGIWNLFLKVSLITLDLSSQFFYDIWEEDILDFDFCIGVT